jgi:hypothetical protein
MYEGVRARSVGTSFCGRSLRVGAALCHRRVYKRFHEQSSFFFRLAGVKKRNHFRHCEKSYSDESDLVDSTLDPAALLNDESVASLLRVHGDVKLAVELYLLSGGCRETKSPSATWKGYSDKAGFVDNALDQAALSRRSFAYMFMWACTDQPPTGSTKIRCNAICQAQFAVYESTKALSTKLRSFQE